MEHMGHKWVTAYDEDSGAWQIHTDDVYPWYICEMIMCLPDDIFGEKTAKAICEIHNRHLKEQTND